MACLLTTILHKHWTLYHQPLSPHPFFFPFSDAVSLSFSLLLGISLGTDGSFSFSSCSLRLADFFRTSKSESGSTSSTSSSGMVRARVRGVVPAGTLKVRSNSTGMLSLKNSMSVLAFWDPNVLWVIFKQGALSTVPSTRDTYTSTKQSDNFICTNFFCTVQTSYINAESKVSSFIF